MLSEKEITASESKVLNKPSAFISLSPIKERLNTIQYKYYDILLYNAKKMIAKNGKTDKFEIKLSVLKNLAGDKTTQNKRTKEYIEKLMDLSCVYNILGKENKMEQNGIFALVAGIDMKTKPGTLIYSFPHQIMEVLTDGMFAKIDLSLIRQFKSKYSIRLYELCKDYENSPRFPEIPIEKLNRLLDYDYDKIERIKSCVLNPAIKEINNNNEVDFFVHYALLKSSENNQFRTIQFKVNRRVYYPDGLGKKMRSGDIKLKDGTILPKKETEFTVEIEKIGDVLNESYKTENDIVGENGVTKITMQEEGLDNVVSEESVLCLHNNCHENANVDSVSNDDVYSNVQSVGNNLNADKNAKPIEEPLFLFDINTGTEQGNQSDKPKKKKRSGNGINFNFESQEWENIQDNKITLWKSAYPACDINTELNAMKAWLIENPERRKVNYGKFIVNWLSRSQQRGGNRNKNGYGYNSKTVKTFADIRTERNMEALNGVIKKIRAGEI